MKKITAYTLIIFVILFANANAGNHSTLLITMPPVLAANNSETGNAQDGSDGNDTSNIKTVTSAGLVWMDRNLAGARAAINSADSEAYGDLYQWGRGTDGHEKRDSPFTLVHSTFDVPGHNNFIISGNTPYDWRTPKNDNLWQGKSGINNPCPPGFRLPTDTELSSERVSWISNDAAGAFASPAKFVVSGYRDLSNSTIYYAGSVGSYWTSTVDGTNSRYLLFDSSLASMFSGGRAYGCSVRCLQD